MKLNTTLILLLLGLVGLLAVGFLPTQAADLGKEEVDVSVVTKQQRSQPLPRLFDFEYYKSVFKKKYSSLREELVRRKIVLAKAFRAFVSGIAYKYRQSKFYLALNPRSDRTPAENKRSLPKIKPFSGASTVKQPEDKADEPELVDEADVERELEEIRQKAAETDNEAFKKIATELEKSGSEKHRAKRDADISPVRLDFSLDKLINTEGADQKQPLDNIPSNNPNYEPPEVTSFGMEAEGDAPMDPNELDRLLKKDDYIDITSEAKVAHEQPLPDDETGQSNQSFFNWVLSSFMPSFMEPEQPLMSAAVELGDHRYVDHSKSKCMIPVGNQGDCGSCYAFAMTAYYSWLLCKKIGSLAHISEQYIVDCGPMTRYKPFLNGCDGGVPEYGSGFFEEFGSELASKYPYVAREGACPYENVEEYDRMGYIRWGEGAADAIRIPKRKFESQLKKSPIVIAIGTQGGFLEYGGGIHDGKDCCKGIEDACDEHAVLLVGHGREDGEDYWLIRNSHSVHYGEKGYYRLNKKADCIRPHEGFIFTPSKTGDIEDIDVFANAGRSRHVQKKINNLHRYINYTKPAGPTKYYRQPIYTL